MQEAPAKSMMVVQQLQHLHQLAAVMPVPMVKVPEELAAQAVEELIIMLGALETLLQLLQVKEVMEEVVLMQETAGLLPEAAVIHKLEVVALVQDLMEVALEGQEETELQIQLLVHP
jgi:hypothetical protein